MTIDILFNVGWPGYHYCKYPVSPWSTPNSNLSMRPTNVGRYDQQMLHQSCRYCPELSQPKGETLACHHTNPEPWAKTKDPCSCGYKWRVPQKGQPIIFSCPWILEGNHSRVDGTQSLFWRTNHCWLCSWCWLELRILSHHGEQPAMINDYPNKNRNKSPCNLLLVIAFFFYPLRWQLLATRHWFRTRVPIVEP